MKTSIIQFLAITLLGTLLPNIIYSQQTISGIVKLKSQTPIAYVNIGIEGAGVGTVSDADGRFELDIPPIEGSKPLTFSAIGYKTVAFPISNTTNEIEAYMEEEVYAVEEVLVNASKLKSRILGNKVEKDNIQSGFEDNSLGAEFALKMKVKRREVVYPKTINFRLSDNVCDSLFFRVNFYNIKGGKPGKNITPKSIYFSTYTEKGDVSVDLTQYNLSFDDDFFVSLEWVRDQCPAIEESGINFSSSLFKKMYYRQTSQASWSKLSAVAIGVWLEVAYGDD